MGEKRRNYLMALGLGFEDGLEVIFLRKMDRVFHRGTAISLN
jgi:hypothetical protein